MYSIVHSVPQVLVYLVFGKMAVTFSSSGAAAFISAVFSLMLYVVSFRDILVRLKKQCAGSIAGGSSLGDGSV